MNKNMSRLRRAKTTRFRIRKQQVARLTVHRSNQHISAQVINASGDRVIAAVSTQQAAVREGLKGTNNIQAAIEVGRRVAEQALAAGIESLAFDRSGFRYHGRVKALADAAREAGLKF